MSERSTTSEGDYVCAHGNHSRLLVNPELLVYVQTVWREEKKKKKKNVHNSIRGIHTSCRTENRRLSCLPHSPSQKFYTAQLFPGLSIKSRGWRPQDSQSQASSEECALSCVRRWRKVFTVFHRPAISQVFKSFSTFLSMFWTKFHSHGQNHHDKWTDIIGYTSNLYVGLICQNENDQCEILKFIEKKPDMF